MHFREVCSSQHPQKISKPAKAIFFGRKKIWIHANPITEQKVTWSPTASVWRGGSPSPNFLAYSQLDEMPHVCAYRCQILGTSKNVKIFRKKIYIDQSIITFLFLRVRSSSLESDQVSAETFISEHFQILLSKI